MRIAVAPNAFRGSLTAVEAADCICAGLSRSPLAPDLTCVPLPLADGGDGTLDILLYGLGGERQTLSVTGPLGVPVRAEIGLLSGGRTALIEMARASGVELILPAERNPLLATSYGTGELVMAAYDRGYRHFVIGIGGSATVEGGAGCLQALGVRLLDSAGHDIPRGGAGLARLHSVDSAPARERLSGAQVTILCDVTNPLTGPNGAAYVFGPQKGADPDMVKTLDDNLAHFAAILRRDLGVDIEHLPGSGAAGGFGAGMVACLGAELAPGAPTLIELLGYREKLAGADLIVTGEGKIDAQTVGGKAVQRIAALGGTLGIPVVALAGLVDATPADLREIGIRAAWSIVPGPCSLETALANAREWLTNAAETLGGALAVR